MKKIYSTLFALIIVNIATAQLTLTKAFNGPVSGNSYTQNYYDTTTAISRATGTNKVWNYSSVVTGTTQSSTTTYTTASSVPGASTAFPSANLASFNPPASAFTQYDMIKSNSNNEETLGTMSGTTVTTYSNTEIEIVYPFTFGSTNSDVSGYTAGTGTNTTYQTSTVTVTGSGTGTLILPGNITLTNCLQVKLYGLLSATISGMPITYTVTGYIYYHASQKFPVASFSVGKFVYMSQTSYDYGFAINNAVVPVGIKENYNTSAFDLFPNPASDKITITTGVNAPKELAVSITDVTGKLVKTETVKTEEKNYIDLSCFEKGIYFLQINMNGTISRKKFIKE